MAEEIAQEILKLLKIEEESPTFATENIAHSWEDVRAIEPVLERVQQVHRRRHRVQYLTQHPGNIHGRKGGNLRFGHEIVGAGSALNTGATPANDTLQKCLKAAMGGSESDAGSTILGGGATTTVLPVQAGHGTRFAPGTCIMVEGTGDDDENEVRPIKSVSTDDLTLEIALSNAPGDTDNVWNSYTAYIDPSATGTLQAQLIGEASADVWLALGLAGAFSLENLLMFEDVATLAFDFMITKWEKDTASIAAGSYDEPDPLGTDEECELHYQTVDTTTINLVSVSDLKIAPGLTWNLKKARGNSDKEHTDRAHMRGGVATGAGPTCEFTADIDDDFRTVFDAQTKKQILYTFGRTAGSSWAIYLPNCEQHALPGVGAHDEQSASVVQLGAHQNDAGDASTALMKSPIIISRL